MKKFNPQYNNKNKLSEKFLKNLKNKPIPKELLKKYQQSEGGDA